MSWMYGKTKRMSGKNSEPHSKSMILEIYKDDTLDNRFRMVLDESIAHEPKTACSGKLGFLRFSESFITQFPVTDGHRFIKLRMHFDASLMGGKRKTN